MLHHITGRAPVLLALAKSNPSVDVRVHNIQPASQSVMRSQSALSGSLVAAQVVATCFMAWKALSLWAGTPYPVMVVTTESMLPAFAPGDVLFVTNHRQNVAIGDLPVCWLPGKAFPMVHRVHRVMYGEQSNSNPDPVST
ncbi:hypothetical protein BDW68DRAFT_153151 [Aspergillus falconensis]